jgi:large subunit ribosomal protein L30
MAKNPKLKVKLKKSKIGHPGKIIKVVDALGLKRTNDEVLHDDTPIIRGMLNKVTHLVTVEVAE